MLKEEGLPAGVTLGSCTVLEAAGDGALPTLLKTLESSISQTNTNNEQVIWIHVGVNSGSSKFALERRAVNEATFLCPDQLGWQPQQIPVVLEDGGISRSRQAVSFAIMSITTHFGLQSRRVTSRCLSMFLSSQQLMKTLRCNS
ncbi:hypothetical protein CISIN_1g030286mg [Citrus sinensis]|uniref:Uncharacterized protein n=1 Tax=Citrus sinensis TaxID=2711 RepID=A0A067GUK5_CITSI|nr:hypothetical protein CISIN_1g030286mg [Citrus sinensis]